MVGIHVCTHAQALPNIFVVVEGGYESGTSNLDIIKQYNIEGD